MMDSISSQNSQPTVAGDRLLNQSQVAAMIGMSEAWLEQCRFRKIGIPFIRIGRAIRYRESAVNEYLLKQTVCTGI